jgi:hypothetical protein
MADAPTTQQVFERFLRGELSQKEAADAIIGITVAHKAKGDRPGALAIQKPKGLPLSAADFARAEALMAELDRRAAGQ